MKLSEAMTLGSTITDLRPYHLDHCALGAAANAVGIPSSATMRRQRFIVTAWPWLQDNEHMAWDYIARKFNAEVCSGRMTFDRLVEWVRSAEPGCGECCRFECSCPVAVLGAGGVEVEQEAMA